MKHFIVTRIGIDYEDPKIVDNIEYRENLMDKTLFHSLKFSKVKPIQIFLVSKKNSELWERLKKRGVVLYTKRDDMDKTLTEYLNTVHDWCTLVTRVDSDDCFSPEYFWEIQKQAYEYNNLFFEDTYRLSFCHWILYSTLQNKAFILNRAYTNMFFTMVHKWEKIDKSVHSVWHMWLYEKFRWQHIRSWQPMRWLISHWENISTNDKLVGWRNLEEVTPPERIPF